MNWLQRWKRETGDLAMHKNAVINLIKISSFGLTAGQIRIELYLSYLKQLGENIHIHVMQYSRVNKCLHSD